MGSKIGVIGGGNIGSSLALDCALRDSAVLLVEKGPDECESSLAKIEEMARFAPMLTPLAKQKPIREVLSNITFTTELKALAGCNVVVENITENVELKRHLYDQLGEVIDADAVLAANTSCIPVTKLGSFFKSPEQVIGVHFMNPVYLKPSVEVIVGCLTSELTQTRCLDALGALGKKSILVKDGIGFVSNRVSHLFMNEAAFTVQDGLAEPKSVDQIFRECFGHKMGPLETADLIGIDTVVYSLNVLYEQFQDPKYRVCPLMKQMVDAGYLGKKAGRGFYHY